MENPFNPGYWAEADLSGFGFAAVGTNVRVAKNCTILGLENIFLGSNVRIDGPTVISASTGYVRIGSYVHVGGMSFIAGAGGVMISDFAGLSQGVKLYSVSDDYSGDSLTNPTIPREFLKVTIAPITLGKHVIVGAGTVVLPGCAIGEGASVGALSLVTKSLEPWGVFFGAPVRRIKRRSRKLLELERLLMARSGLA